MIASRLVARKVHHFDTANKIGLYRREFALSFSRGRKSKATMLASDQLFLEVERKNLPAVNAGAAQIEQE
jgi:hypothetical protein